MHSSDSDVVETGDNDGVVEPVNVVLGTQHITNKLETGAKTP